jgi:AcrR family transcriptional regulator
MARTTKKTMSGRVRTPALAEPAPLRDRILNAAFASFMEKGYAGTSTLDIATRAKVSKRDVYAVCSDKSALLREAIAERSQQMRLPLELPPATDRRGLEKMLAAFGSAVMQGVCEKPVLTVFRLAIAESFAAPDLARTLEVARNANRVMLARILAAAQKSGFLKAGDPTAMMTDFLGLLWGDLLLRLLLRASDPPSPRAMERMAQDATDKFLKLYG